MTEGEKIIAKAEVVQWLIRRYSFYGDNWITGWQTEVALRDIGIKADHDECMDLLMEMGTEGLILKPNAASGSPMTWKLPEPLMKRRLIAHRRVTGGERRRFLAECRSLCGIQEKTVP